MSEFVSSVSTCEPTNVVLVFFTTAFETRSKLMVGVIRATEVRMIDFPLEATLATARSIRAYISKKESKQSLFSEH